MSTCPHAAGPDCMRIMPKSHESDPLLATDSKPIGYTKSSGQPTYEDGLGMQSIRNEQAEANGEEKPYPNWDKSMDELQKNIGRMGGAADEGED
ncbi:hypothetical protein LTS14_009511 [Recurvomyces mirabilis]|nr:hypothetical protein LTS14_009511 [Recurvomyces mirabilis]